MTNIKSGKYKILKTGTVITFEDNPIEIFLKEYNSLRLIVDFKSDEDFDGTTIRAKVLDDEKKLKIELINFKSGLSEGNLNPMMIGSIEEKDVFFNFRCSKLDKSKSRLLHYTLYQKNG